MHTSNITVIGAGSWGTALALTLLRSGQKVCLWARDEHRAAQMKSTRQNDPYLGDVELPADLDITADLEVALTGTQFVVVATPSQAVRTVMERCRPYVHPEAILVSVAKGIENRTLLLTTDVMASVMENHPRSRLGVLYGPSHAEEVARAMPTTVVAAAHGEATCTSIQDTFMSDTFRVYANSDIMGVQIAGSVKNVLAIAAGISDGIGFGDNAKAAIVTRGLAEMRRLGVAMGASPETFAGLAGIGDLVVTCMSGLSRNRHLGEQIGKGRSLQDIENEMQMVAEGVRTTESVHALAQNLGLDLPITAAVFGILFEGRQPMQEVINLMTRSARPEDEAG